MTRTEDDRWAHLTSGYRMAYDPRPALARLRAGQDEDAAWKELWEELHHQGDVGDASYAAVPELVRIYKDRGIVHWNAYAMVAIIELQRTENGNPKIPSWLEEDYFAAVQELAVIGGHELCQTSDPEVIGAMLGLVAVARGLRVFGKVLSCYSEQEVKDMLANL